MKTTSRTIATLILLWLGTAGWAAAAEGGESNLFAGDLGNFVWTLLIFLVVLFVLGKFAWGPLLTTLQERENFIRDSLEQARSDREAAEARLEEYTEKLHEARAEATKIVEEGRRDAEEVKRRIESDAREETERMVARARREIDIAKQTALKEIYSVGASLATRAASKIVRQELKAADHERLIAESIAELEKTEAN